MSITIKKPTRADLPRMTTGALLEVRRYLLDKCALHFEERFLLCNVQIELGKRGVNYEATDA